MIPNRIQIGSIAWNKISNDVLFRMHDGIIRRHAAKDQENDANQWEAHETEEEGVRHLSLIHI